MISFEHANSLCKGSRLVADITPETDGGDGYFYLAIHNQSSLARVNDDGMRKSPVFDGDFTHIALSVNQVTHLLFVLEGKAKCLCNGKGLFENADNYIAHLHCDRVEGKTIGCQLHITVKADGDERQYDGRITLNLTEMATLAKAFNAAMDRVAFGR